MKENKLPTAAELKFKPLLYSEDYPPVSCCMCGKNVPATGGYIADVHLFPGEAGKISLIVCSFACGLVSRGEKAGKVTSFIIKEYGRLKRLFPKKEGDL